MKTLLLLSADKDFLNSLSQKNRKFYERLFFLAQKNNLLIIRSSIYEFNSENKIFLSGEYFQEDTWIHVSNIRPDAIWYKSNTVNQLVEEIEKLFPFVNSSNFLELANDKLKTSVFSSDISPLTHEFNSNGINQFISKGFEEVVLKPSNGSSGEGIQKIKTQQINNLIFGEYKDYIIQEMIDSSTGIDGITSGVHDIRLLIFGKELFPYVVLRTPQKGDFRCNIALGGNAEYILLNKLPSEGREQLLNLHNKLITNFGLIFGSIDICYSNNRYYLIEYNSSSAIYLFYKDKKLEEEYFHAIINFFNINYL